MNSKINNLPIFASILKEDCQIVDYIVPFPTFRSEKRISDDITKHYTKFLNTTF